MAELTPFLGKTYKLKSSENFDEYLKFVDVGFMSRKAASSVTPCITLQLNPDGSYTLTVVTSLKTVKTDFRLGEEFDEIRADGAKNKSTVTVEGTKLIQTAIDEKGRKSTHVREFSENQLTMTTTVEGWNGRCLRVYEAVE